MVVNLDSSANRITHICIVDVHDEGHDCHGAATEANNSRILTAETSPALATAIALFASSTLAILGGGPIDPLVIYLIYWAKNECH